MAPKRKKSAKSKVLGEETLSGRRSSLHVNLSFVSGLCDSGNGSLHRSQTEIAVVNEPQELRRSVSDFGRNGLSDIAEDTSSIACAEQAALSAINEKEQALDHSCKLLKAAILSKTRELFDRKAELSVKTASVLKGERQALKEIHNDSKLLRKKLTLSKTSPMLGSVSKNRSPMRSPETRAKVDSPSVGRLSNRDESFILGGSNKSYRNVASPKLGNKVLRVRLTRIADPRLRTSFESLQGSIVDDIGMPLTCSSFISGHASPASQQAESDGRGNVDNRDVEEPLRRAESSTSSLTPMEMTTVQGAIPSTKSFASLRRSGRITQRSGRSVKDVPMELTTVQSNIPLRDSASSNKTARTSLNVNTSADELSHKLQSRNSEGASTVSKNDNTRVDRTAHISLRVNTSLGTEESPAQETEINDDSKTERSVEKSTDEETADRSRRGGRDSTVNSLLVARLRQLLSGRSMEAADNSKLGRVDRSSLGEGSSFVEGTPFPRRRASPGKEPTFVEGSSFARRRSSLGDGPSFIEGTPFPPSRSMLWKTQIRLGTIRNRTARRPPPADAESGSSRDSTNSTEYLTPPNGTVVLSESPSRHTCNTSNPQIIQDSSDEDQPAQTACVNVSVPKENATPNIQRSGKKKLLSLQQNLELISLSPLSPAQIASANVSVPKANATPNIQRSGKKKLMSLQQNLELISLSPLSPAVLTPKKPITWKPKRKRKVVRAIAVKRIDQVREEADDEAEPPFVSRINTQKEQTNAKKPRKVVSKKIVVKKIAGLDIFEQLEGVVRTASDHESAIGERSSINEFTKRRRLSVAGRSLKAEKLVIVATGFAKSDVELVKRIARNLGGAEISSTVSRRTTHVVSTGVRTINLLRGIIRGCWLVSLDWVLRSSEHEKWLSAEQYEMVHFSKAVQENRRDRQLFGKAYVPELFTTCGLIYIEHGSTPPPEILKELVKTAGGRITEDQRNAKLTVGPGGLREIWILDSITTGDLQPIKEYERK